jgi:4-amino-4-deoxy-L-arabinose transferase-like glycosyltransferase
MTKGPIGVILPAVIIALYLAVLKDAGIFRKWTIMAAAFLAFLAVVLPWYIIIYKLHGKAFVDVFFGIHNITRFLEPEHKAGAKIYYYIPVLLGGFFPWSAFLPFGLWRAFKGARSPLPGERRGHVFLLLWFVIIFVFFSAASTRLPTYIFPAFAAAALIVGRAWDEFLDRTGRQSAAKGLIFSYWLLLLAAIAGAAGLCIFIRLDYPILVRGALASGGVLLSGFLFSAVFFMKKRFFWAFLAIIASIAAFIIPLNRFVVPEIERYEASKEISAKLIELMKPGGTIGAEKDYLAGVSFYTGKDIVPINWHHELVRLLEKRGRAWCVLKEKNHIQLYTVDTKPQYLRPSYMVYKLGKKCIITNLPPEDGVWLAKRERAAR